VTAAKRARSDQAKIEKRQRLIDAARALFGTREFAGITVDEIAAASGVSKGTVFVYFGTREELFLAVARELFDDYFASLTEAIGGEDVPGSADRLKGFILSSFEGRDDFLKMLPLLGVLIEKNVSDGCLRDFKRFLLGGLVSLGGAADRVFPFLPAAGGGARFFFWIYGVVIGFLNLADPGERARGIIEAESMDPFRFEFGPELEAFLGLVLRGMDQAPAVGSRR
jgi:AcrR family transcriptional regulator